MTLPANQAGMPGPSPSGPSSLKPTAPRSMSFVSANPLAVSGHEGLRPPAFAASNRTMSTPHVLGPPRSSSLVASGAPGSFSADMRSTTASRLATLRADYGSSQRAESGEKMELTESELQVVDLRERLNKEMKIKEGSENMLEALNTKKAKQTKEQRARVESELNAANRNIGQLKIQIEELQQPKPAEGSSRSRISNLFRGNVPRSISGNMAKVAADSSDEAEDAESPTFALSEILLSLEAAAMSSDYYIERANSLVELFKRHPTLKYDLAWSDFGLQMQTLLLSDSREVVAAGYRVTRYAITDRKSLQTIRGLNTDYLVILSLVKEGKANVEREQALKFVRAFLDVKDGVEEISCAVLRTVVSVADHDEDRLRSICIETLAEILIRAPALVVAAGGIRTLTASLTDGKYEVPESLVTAFLYLLDMPRGRKYLHAGQGLEVVFSAFADSLQGRAHDQRLKSNARVVRSALRTWSGLALFAMDNFRAVKSLVLALRRPFDQTRDIIFELLFDILRIKLPSWSSSFLAGRRLTTYGRVTNLRSEGLLQVVSLSADDYTGQHSLVDHFISLILAILFESGLVEVLYGLLNGDLDALLRRKATLLLGEVLTMGSRLLPDRYNVPSQLLPDLYSWATAFGLTERFVAASTVYQLDSVNRTLQRSGAATAACSPTSTAVVEYQEKARPLEQSRIQISAQIDEAQFRNHMLESQVLGHTNYTKWRWDILHAIVDGPLLNPKRLDEAIKATRFMKRLLDFYRPFKYRFADIRNTKPNQRYVRVGCSLLSTLLQTPDGVRYLMENKLLPQIAECLAQLDPKSGLTSSAPLFSPGRLAETLSSGYFSFIGTLSKDPKGMAMLERWRMINICHHLIGLSDRDDLIRLLLGHVDFSLNSHFRVMLSKALTGCAKDIRIYATSLLRPYALRAGRPGSSAGSSTHEIGPSEWAIRLLMTQLYDPDVEVCETAVRILEEACNRTACLEFVVRCCPALDHLGEIGAPLLLRFLSSSLGYRYLDDLDYITREMDDWFLGRNETYVTLVEANMAQAMQTPDGQRQSTADLPAPGPSGVAPPHFYRELTRTAEGCKLLVEKGHFVEFVHTLRECWMEQDDAEVILKVKGYLWAIGNVGSMELGAPFIEESKVIELIVQIAEESEVVTLRGTAFFVLGLISRSRRGSQLVVDYGWTGAVGPMCESAGLCIPVDLGPLFSVCCSSLRARARVLAWAWGRPADGDAGGVQMRSWGDEATEADLVAGTVDAAALAADDDDALNARVLDLVVNSCNSILTGRTYSDFLRLRDRKPPGYHDPAFFRKVMGLLEGHHYHLPMRRFILDQFDKSVLRRIVLDDDEVEAGVEVDADADVDADAPAAAKTLLDAANDDDGDMDVDSDAAVGPAP
ncbi:MAG: hypothetical protein M1826_006749 [Phylliscum demangeonii]|nr:MAG: hypothetical protein M1826_006749 [Phylliscum demangeonii]